HLGDHADCALTKLARILVGSCHETDPSKESSLRTRRGDSECLTWVHTAPGGTRPLFAEFLREAAELLPAAERESWREAAREADAAGECWARVADTAAAGSTGNTDSTDSTDKEATFDEFADLVEQAIAHEERMVVQLSR
ncbi:MAG: DUF4872 domain-containing protein, partial [Actinobacteria bacterium]|nr:DUF4872 domain-containing protein [Actinomycetota bacterium]